MMYYKKPNDVTYTDMCIWIDKNAYKEDVDEQKIFEYLYHISRMLAYKKRYFEKASYYDDFAIFMATQLFMRFKNPKQFDETKKLKKIKSVLNYAKGMLYSTKIQFEQQEYAQNNVSIDDEVEFDYSLHNTVMSSIDDLRVSDFRAYLGDIVQTVKCFVYKLPHRNRAEIDNIYTSCLLSFLNSVVLSNKNRKKMIELKSADKLTPEHIDRFYKEERKNCIILYHLCEEYRDYITVLVNEIRHLISEDLMSIINDDSMVSESNAKNILMSSIYFGNDS